MLGIELWHSADRKMYDSTWLQPLMMGRTRRFSVRDRSLRFANLYGCAFHISEGNTLGGNNIFYIIGVIVVIIVVLKLLGLY